MQQADGGSGNIFGVALFSLVMNLINVHVDELQLGCIL